MASVLPPKDWMTQEALMPRPPACCSCGEDVGPVSKTRRSAMTFVVDGRVDGEGDDQNSNSSAWCNLRH